MPVFKYFTIVGSALLALLLVSDALFGESQRERRFDPSFYDSATYAPRAAAIAADERYFTADVTPAERVAEVFGQFTVNDGKRTKRYSSLSSVIR
uniref:Uncharacterized protein n=1 Tax=Rhodopseudomonas palustris (strain BisA53) TaxID=316055 RepID=Q07N14_RHOP5